MRHSEQSLGLGGIIATTKRGECTVRVGERIRMVREALEPRMSQTELARLARVPISTLSSIEGGDSVNPRSDITSRLAAALNVDGHWLMTGEGSRSRKPDGEEDDLLRLYRAMTEPNRTALFAAARALVGTQTKEPSAPGRFDLGDESGGH